jgi:hypothetical protein
MHGGDGLQNHIELAKKRTFLFQGAAVRLSCVHAANNVSRGPIHANYCTHGKNILNILRKRDIIVIPKRAMNRYGGESL